VVKVRFILLVVCVFVCRCVTFVYCDWTPKRLELFFLVWGLPQRTAILGDGFCRISVPPVYPVEFHGKTCEIFHGDYMKFHVKYSIEFPLNTTFSMVIPCGPKYMRTLWKLYGISWSSREITWTWSLHGVFIWFCPRDIKMPWRIYMKSQVVSHGVSIKNFTCFFFSMEFYGV